VTGQVILITTTSNGSIIFRLVVVLVGLSVSLAHTGHSKTKLNFLFFIVKLAVIRRNITINMKIPIEVTVFCPKFIMISILDGVYIESMYIDGESVTSAGR
jgi:hypothetical protein